ncbi:hypothetical protein D3C87_1265140 [compost metagenome]
MPSPLSTSLPYLASPVVMATVDASAPSASLVSTLPVMGVAVSSVTEAVSSLALGAVSMIWMTRSLLVVLPAASVTLTVKLSRTESSPAEWLSAPPVSL